MRRALRVIGIDEISWNAWTSFDSCSQIYMSHAILSIIPFHESANSNVTGTNQLLFTVDINVSETDRYLIIKFKLPASYGFTTSESYWQKSIKLCFHDEM